MISPRAIASRPRRVLETLESRTLFSAGSPLVQYGVEGIVAGSQFDKTHVLGGGYQAIEVQSDGRVVVGDSIAVNGHDVFYLRRLNAGGGVDKTFGTGGVVELFLPQRDLLLTGLLIQPNGQIVATGTADNFHNASGIDTSITSNVVARFNANGKIDGSFGQAGVVLLAVTGGSAQSLATDVSATIENGGLVITSPTQINRLTTTGMIDPGFTPISSSSLPIAATFVSTAVDFNGEILVGLSAESGVARITQAGQFDPSFGVNGVYTDADLPIDRVTQILPRGDGSIILVTAHDDGNNRGDDLVDLMSNGATDVGFGTAGVIPTLPAADFAAPVVSISEQFDGRLLLVSAAIPYSENLHPNGFIVQRFFSDGTVDPTFGTGGIATFDGTVVAGQAAGSALDSSGRLIVSAGNATLVAVDTTGNGGNFTGTIFNDRNANRVLNTGETGLAGATAWIDYNKDGVFDGADIRITADANGVFTFPTLPVGQYVLRVDPIAGYALTTKPYLTVTVKQDQTLTGFNFGELKLGSVAGMVTAGGVPLAGVQVFVDINHNGVFNSKTDILTTTATDGTFSFGSLPRGAYRVVQIVPAGYKRATKSNVIGVKVGLEQDLTGVVFADLPIE